MTYTVTVLRVSVAAYDEIAGKLRAAGSGDVIFGDASDERIDMTHIALAREGGDEH